MYHVTFTKNTLKRQKKSLRKNTTLTFCNAYLYGFYNKTKKS